MSRFGEIPTGNQHPAQHNLAATAPPTATDDSAAGYEEGSVWVDVTNNKAYICVDAAATSAIWTETTGGGGGATELNGLTDVTTGLPVSPTNADYGRVLYFDNVANDWISDDFANISNVVKPCKTASGTIAKGVPVYLADFDGDLLVVAAADSANAGTMPCIGITAEQIDATATPNSVVSFGKIQNIDTTGLSTGQALWVKSGGGLATARPTGTDLVQQVAVVLKENSTTGSIKVFNTSRVANLPNLTNGKIWQGDVNGHPVEVDPATAAATWNPPKSSLEDWTRGNSAALTTAANGDDYFFFVENSGGPGGVANPQITTKFHLGKENGLDYDGSNLALRLHNQLFVLNGVGGDNVRWEVEYIFFLDGDDGVNKASTTFTFDVDYSTRTVANGLYTDIITGITGVAGAKELRIWLRRKNTDAADTYNQDVDFFGIDLIKV
jgi:hypothetical protein